MKTYRLNYAVKAGRVMGTYELVRPKLERKSTPAGKK